MTSSQHAGDDSTAAALISRASAFVYAPRPQSPAAVQSSCRLQGRSAGRNFYEVAAAGTADRKRSAKAHCRILRGREGDPRRPPRGAPSHAAAEKPAIGQDLRALTTRQAGSQWPKDQARYRHLLSATLSR